MSTNLVSVRNPLPELFHNRDQFFTPFEQMFDSFFDGFFGDNPTKDKLLRGNVGFPKLDIYENNGKWMVEASMAGANPDNVDVEITMQDGRRVLTISGKMEGEYQHRDGAKYYVKGLTRKHFRRSLVLPEYIQNDPEALFHNGMLTLSWDVPEATKTQSRKISVKTAHSDGPSESKDS